MGASVPPILRCGRAGHWVYQAGHHRSIRGLWRSRTAAWGLGLGAGSASRWPRSCERRADAPSLLLVIDEARRLRRRAAWPDARSRLRLKAPCKIQNLTPTHRSNAGTGKRGRRRRPPVDHEKERRRVGPMFASSPAPRQSVGRGHRRGLDGPTMPKSLLKNGECFSPPAKLLVAVGRAGVCAAWETGATRALAACDQGVRTPARPRCADRFGWKPAEFGRSGRIPTHGDPAEQTTARPAARMRVASAKRTQHPAPSTNRDVRRKNAPQKRGIASSPQQELNAWIAWPPAWRRARPSW